MAEARPLPACRWQGPAGVVARGRWRGGESDWGVQGGGDSPYWDLYDGDDRWWELGDGGSNHWSPALTWSSKRWVVMMGCSRGWWWGRAVAGVHWNRWGTTEEVVARHTSVTLQRRSSARRLDSRIEALICSRRNGAQVGYSGTWHCSADNVEAMERSIEARLRARAL
jgi:hypothetical protein